jgi:adenylate cyclase class 2
VLEVEAKYRTAGWELIQAKLSEWGATAELPREDSDRYFNAPDRDFARTDEALRLRCTGATNVLTYKGPKRDKDTKTRTEYELPLADGPTVAAVAEKFLTSLGYTPVALVTKVRQVYHLRRGGFDLEVCLDDVGPVGRFVELEIRAEDDRFEVAKEVLLETAQELGLIDQERQSYLQLLLAQSNGTR